MTRVNLYKREFFLKLVVFIMTTLLIIVLTLPRASSQTMFQIQPASGCGQATVNAQSLLPLYVPVPFQTTGITYSWNFGNGQTSTAQNPTGINYVAPGTYMVNFSAIIDTVGYFLTSVDVSSVVCTDPFFGAPDMYIIIIDGSNQIVHTTQSLPFSDTNPLVSWILNLHLNNPPYYFWIWDEDTFDSDDNCVNDSEVLPGVSTLIPLPANNSVNFGNSSFSSLNGGLQFTLHFYKEVIEVVDSSMFFVHEIPAPPVMNIQQAWYCEGQLVDPIYALHNPGHLVTWYSDSTLNNIIHNGSEYIFSHSQSGTYNFYVTQTDTITNCESDASVVTVNIGPLPPPFVMNGNSIFCEGEVLPPLSTTGHLVLWFDNISLTDTIHIGDTLTLNISQPGVYEYWVVVENEIGCNSEPAYITVEISPRLLADIIVNNESCKGYANGSAHVNLLNGYPPYTFLWSNGQNTQTATNLTEGEYHVMVIDSLYCLRTFSTIVGSNPAMQIFANIENVSCEEKGGKGSITIEVSGGTPPYSAQWSTMMSGFNIEDLDVGNYFLTVTDLNNCRLDTSYVLSVKDDCFLPATVLTPNGDGLNDVWIIRSIEYFPQAEVVVYDRNGVIVFQSSGVYEPWDGSYKGKTLPVGSYYFHIYIIRENGGQSYQGIVDIVR